MSQFANPKPFQPMRTEEERSKDSSEVYSVRLNKEEEALILSVEQYVQQAKPTTLIKQLALIAARRVLRDEEMRDFLIVAVNNTRRNMETGVPIKMPSDKKILGNVILPSEDL